MSRDPLPDLEEIRETLSLMDDWEDRLGFVIDLGRRLPPLDDKSAATRVDGCMSQVWLRLEPEAPGLVLHGDSDAQIPKGLLAVLAAIVQHRSRAEIAALDLPRTVAALGLEEMLSPNRRGGLQAMIQRIGRDSAAG